jgi:spermidine/putrescine transport system permease protein
VKRSTLISALQVLPAWAVIGVFLLVPLGVLLKVSLQPADEILGDPVPVDNWAEHFRSGEYKANYKALAEAPPPSESDPHPMPLAVKTFWRSLWISALTAGICLVVSYPVAYYIAIVAPRRWRNLLLVAVAVPFWTSFVIRTSAWKLILGTGGPIDLVVRGLGGKGFDALSTIPAVLIGLVYAELPFMILPLYASLEKLDRTLLSAAADLGAGPWRAFWRVTVPLTMPGIVAGMVLVLIPSIGQYVISDLMSGGKIWLGGNFIDSFFMGDVRNLPMGAASSFALMSVVLLLLAIYAVYARVGARRVSDGRGL